MNQSCITERVIYINRVILIGNLTKDPELRTTNSGVSVCTFSIAVNRKNKNASGERQSDFFNIVAWRGLGELCGKYLMQGKKVCITGELQNRTYEAKDGTKRYITEIIADDVEFLSPKGEAKETPDVSTFEESTDELPF